MLALARGLGTDPSVLLVDELSMGLAPLDRRRALRGRRPGRRSRRVGARGRAVRHRRAAVRQPRVRDGPRRHHLRRARATAPCDAVQTRVPRGDDGDRAPPVHALRADARLRLRHRVDGPGAHLHGHRRLQLRPRRRRHGRRVRPTTSSGSSRTCRRRSRSRSSCSSARRSRGSAPSGCCAASRAPTTRRRSWSRSPLTVGLLGFAQKVFPRGRGPQHRRTCSATTGSGRSTCRSPTTASRRSSSPSRWPSGCASCCSARRSAPACARWSTTPSWPASTACGRSWWPGAAG